MTFGEIIELTKASKHSKIGRVTFYLDPETQKPKECEVVYKSGRHFRYRNKNSIPESVKDFLLQHQNKSISYSGGKYLVVEYFMV